MKLITAGPSPFARKVRIALIEKGIEFEEIPDLPWLKDSIASAYNPLGKIPILLNKDGEKFFDSRLILEYLEILKDDPILIPNPPGERMKTRQIEVLADGISDAVVLITLEMCRKPEMRSSDWLARQRLKIEQGVAMVNVLSSGADWLVGSQISVGDIAVACTLSYLELRLPDYKWRQSFPKLSNFSDYLEKRESFIAPQPEIQELPHLK